MAKLLNLHRRKQQVVVTTSSRSRSNVAVDRRKRCPTLPGLGYRVELDTIDSGGFMQPPGAALTRTPPPRAAENVDFDEETPISCVRPKLKSRTIPQAARVPTRPKPVTLFDGGVDDQRAREYLEEARRILESGVFDSE